MAAAWEKKERKKNEKNKPQACTCMREWVGGCVHVPVYIRPPVRGLILKKVRDLSASNKNCQEPKRSTGVAMTNLVEGDLSEDALFTI